MTTILEALLADLAGEGDRLRAIVADLPAQAWRTATPAAGWDVATQIAHLASTDEAALAAVASARGDRAAWDAVIQRAIADPEHFVDVEALAGAQAEPAEILARWDASRHGLAQALPTVQGKVPWFGTSMSPASMATARLMETWAHGLDVHQALGLEPVITDAISHICRLGVRTRDFAFTVHQLTPPAEEFRIELVGPSGAVWEYGAADAQQRVTGPAYDFARLVTQRIHRDDTTLTAVGEDAQRWLSIAQAFAGPSGEGRAATG